MCLVNSEKSTLLCANLGDSRAVLFQKFDSEWEIRPLSEDHKPDNKGEKKRIEESGG